MFVTSGRSRLEFIGYVSIEDPKRFCGTVAEVMDAEAEGEEEIHPSKRQRVAERVLLHVPSEVEPQRRDFNVNEFLRSSPNPVVASVFGDYEIIRRAAVRRGYPVMKFTVSELWG